MGTSFVKLVIVFFRQLRDYERREALGPHCVDIQGKRPGLVSVRKSDVRSHL